MYVLKDSQILYLSKSGRQECNYQKYSFEILQGAAKTKVMRITTSSLNYEHTRQRCPSFIIELRGSNLLAKFRFNEKEKESQAGITGRLISISIV
jgi:hypothetical protein